MPPPIPPPTLRRWSLREHLTLWKLVAFWTLLVTPMAAATGSACALFLWSLDLVTRTRWNHPQLLFALPLAGLAVWAAYRFLGKRAEGGNNLLMDEIHTPGGGVPRRMAPLVLAGTLITHLFGGSAGREGTAIQMGGSIASAWARLLRLAPTGRTLRILLMAGIAAGFGGVFGTPVAGAIFALEVLALGIVRYDALIPCLIAALVSDWACRAWGIAHTDYRALVGAAGLQLPHADPLLLTKTAAAALAFGLTSALFAAAVHAVKAALAKLPAPLRPLLGGAAVIALTLLLGTRDFLGIGVTSPRLPHHHGISIVNAFSAPAGAMPAAWAWKLLFTAITLGSGFKGGEVTPLFFIGATLGNTLAWLLHAPTDLFAALGFVAVFAGATNTPLACTLMAIELFGADLALYAATACFLAYFFSGHTGIYSAQRIAIPKTGAAPASALPAPPPDIHNPSSTS
jgi:H+/Cl- antiporter ClcA